MEVAREFYQQFDVPPFEELVSEYFSYSHEGTGETIHAFRFTPTDSSLKLSSDAFEINVAANSGKILRFRNQYNETTLSMDARGTLSMLEFSGGEESGQPLSPEAIQELHQEEYPDMEYQGRAIIRNYYTEFAPHVVKVFFKEIDGQQAALYFDELTGYELKRVYYPYQPF